MIKNRSQLTLSQAFLLEMPVPTIFSMGLEYSPTLNRLICLLRTRKHKILRQRRLTKIKEATKGSQLQMEGVFSVAWIKLQAFLTTREKGRVSFKTQSRTHHHLFFHRARSIMTMMDLGTVQSCKRLSKSRLILRKAQPNFSMEKTVLLYLL